MAAARTTAAAVAALVFLLPLLEAVPLEAAFQGKI